MLNRTNGRKVIVTFLMVVFLSLTCLTSLYCQSPEQRRDARNNSSLTWTRARLADDNFLRLETWSNAMTHSVRVNGWRWTVETPVQEIACSLGLKHFPNFSDPENDLRAEPEFNGQVEITPGNVTVISNPPVDGYCRINWIFNISSDTTYIGSYDYNESSDLLGIEPSDESSRSLMEALQVSTGGIRYSSSRTRATSRDPLSAADYLGAVHDECALLRNLSMRVVLADPDITKIIDTLSRIDFERDPGWENPFTGLNHPWVYCPGVDSPEYLNAPEGAILIMPSADDPEAKHQFTIVNKPFCKPVRVPAVRTNQADPAEIESSIETVPLQCKPLIVRIPN